MSNAEEFFSNPANYLRKDFGVQVRREIIEDFFGKQFQGSILDLGCGDGSISLQFENAKSIHLVDSSSGMLALIEKSLDRDRTRIKMTKATLESYMDIGSYDMVLSIGLLAHLQDWQGILAKIFAFVSKGGWLVVQISDNSRFLTRLQHRFNQTGNRMLNRIELSQLIELTDALGLELVHMERYGLVFPGMGILSNSLLYRYARWTRNSKIFSGVCSEVILFFKKP